GKYGYRDRSGNTLTVIVANGPQSDLVYFIGSTVVVQVHHILIGKRGVCRALHRVDNKPPAIIHLPDVAIYGDRLACDGGIGERKTQHTTSGRSARRKSRQRRRVNNYILSEDGAATTGRCSYSQGDCMRTCRWEGIVERLLVCQDRVTVEGAVIVHIPLPRCNGRARK